MAIYQQNETFRGLMFLQSMLEKVKKEYVECGKFIPTIYALTKHMEDEANVVCASELPETVHLDGVELIAEKFKTQMIISTFLQKLKDDEIEPTAIFHADLIMDSNGIEHIVTMSRLGENEVIRSYIIQHNQTNISETGELVSNVEFQEEEIE